MRKLTVLLVFSLLSVLPLMAQQQPASPAAGPSEQVPGVAAPLENGACAVEDPGKGDLAIFALEPVYKTCGSITTSCAYPSNKGPCKWSCPCPTYVQCTLTSSGGCNVCIEP